MDNTVVKKSELLIDALQYAHDHNLDVANKNHVQEILNVLDPDHNEDLEDFIQLLNTSETFLNMQAKRNEDKKIDQLN